MESRRNMENTKEQIEKFTQALRKLEETES
jgi:hypothetical protein